MRRTDSGEPLFELLTRAGCHLCDEMEALLEENLPRLGVTYVVRDVDSKSEWRERFGDVVPVLLRQGRPVAKIRLDARRLERIVQRKRWWTTSRDSRVREQAEEE